MFIMFYFFFFVKKKINKNIKSSKEIRTHVAYDINLGKCVISDMMIE